MGLRARPGADEVFVLENEPWPAGQFKIGALNRVRSERFNGHLCLQQRCRSYHVPAIQAIGLNRVLVYPGP